MPLHRRLLLPSSTARTPRRGTSSARTRRRRRAPRPHAGESRRPLASRQTRTRRPSQRLPPRASP
eukprot:8852922-Alexandrium_andersonii.AAC.1